MIDGAPEISPFPTDPYVCFVDMPSQATPGAVCERSLRNFWPELDDPAINRAGINVNATFCQEVSDIAIRQRVSTIPAHRNQYDVGRESMAFEWITLRH